MLSWIEDELRTVNLADKRLEKRYRLLLDQLLFARDPVLIKHVRARIPVGNLYVNRGITGAMVGRQPFGGNRLSGTGTPDSSTSSCVRRRPTVSSSARRTPAFCSSFARIAFSASAWCSGLPSWTRSPQSTIVSSVGARLRGRR